MRRAIAASRRSKRSMNEGDAELRKLLRMIIAYFVHLETRFHSWFVESSPFSAYSYDQKNAREFANVLWHETMLADRERIEKYREAIRRGVRKGDVVVDIGAGTGILSFFAAESAAQVYAVEHADVIEIAETIRADNAIDNVEFVKCNSRDFDLPQRADVIVHEQIGGENPLSENMIANLLDARRRLLKPGGRIIPAKFEIFIEPIQLKEDHVIPFLWEMKIGNIDFRSTAPIARPMSGRRIAGHERRTISVAMVEHCLCEPKPVMSFDLETMEEGDIPRHVRYENVAARDGRIDGLCIYFKAIFDDDLAIETTPTGHVTNWAMLLYRMEQTWIARGETVAYELAIESILNDDAWAFTWFRSQAGRDRSGVDIGLTPARLAD
jgi:protein arginine N-methyltransferase 1